LRSSRRSARARHLLAANLAAPGGAQLLKLNAERLLVGADAGIVKAAVLEVRFGYILP
jgi:hypothetical protein